MVVTSNVKGVIARVSRLRDRDVQEAMHAALRPSNWQQPAYEAAEKTLTALAEQGEQQFIAPFLKTLTAEVFVGWHTPGFVLKMKAPFRMELTIADHQSGRGAVSPSDLGQNLFQKDWDAFKDLMAEWVATEKRKDQRDEGKSDQDIGDWIAYEMLAPDGGGTVRSGKNRGAQVRDVFMPYITDFLKRKQGLSRLPAAKVDAWLRAVLAAWRLMVHDLFPGKFHAALQRARTELALG